MSHSVEINSQTKESLRRFYKRKRQSMDLETCERASQELCRKVLGLSEWQRAKRVMLYLAMPKEVNIDTLVEEAFLAGKEVYVPVCLDKKTMVAAKLTSLQEVVTGVLNIRIPPVGYSTINPEEIDLFLVPGVAFDQKGGRLGMGAGYYDRFLSKVKSIQCFGVAYSWQLSAESIPMESYDKRLGGIITEESIFRGGKVVAE